MPKIIKKCILKRQLAYAIMAVAKKEIMSLKRVLLFSLCILVLSGLVGCRETEITVKSLRKESKVVQTKKQYGDFSLTALSFASISIFSG